MVFLGAGREWWCGEEGNPGLELPRAWELGYHGQSLLLPGLLVPVSGTDELHSLQSSKGLYFSETLAREATCFELNYFLPNFHMLKP